jgi:hypothetical protein
LLIDDYHLQSDETLKTKSVVKTFLRDYVTTGEQVAVVFTSGAKGQDLTSDGSLLLSAVDRLRGQFDPSVPIGIVEMTALSVLDAARDISLDLSASCGAVRKAIVFFSAGIGCAPGAAPSTPGGTLWCRTPGLELPRRHACARRRNRRLFAQELGRLQNAFERSTLEMSQYYLLGYYSTHAGGDTRHKTEIRISRSGTKAFYRRTYVAPVQNDR